MNKLYLALVLTFSYTLTFAQVRSKYIKKADSLYKAKNYAAAGPYYVQSANAAEYNAIKKSDYYNAACCYALAGKTDSAFTLLHSSIANGYLNIKHIKE